MILKFGPPIVLALASTVLADGWTPLQPFSGQVSSDSNSSSEIVPLVPREFSGFGLHERQETCTNPGYVPCPNLAACCPSGDLCFPAGCCPSANENCGGTGCYAPGATCCPSGGACDGTENCLLGHCCAKTAETCGGTGCYTSGATCCTGDNVNACATTEDCCTNGCMPKGKQCCQNGWCELDLICCENERLCCNPGATCCPGTCCPAGSTCSTTYGQCLYPAAPTTEQESTTMTTSSSSSSESPEETESVNVSVSVSVSESVSVSQSTSTTSPTSTKPFSTKLSTPSCTPTRTPGGTSQFCNLGGAAVADAGDFALINGKCLPVMDFIEVDGLTDQLIHSMCGGLAQEVGAGASQMVLTWAGDGSSGQGGRRNSAGCRGFCKGQVDSNGERTECDEFPFASTTQGGKSTTHKECIVWWQNSIQGSSIRCYADFYQLQPQEDFLLRIKTGCSSSSSRRRSLPLFPSPKQKRQSATSDTPTSSTDSSNITTLSSDYNIWKPLVDTTGQGIGSSSTSSDRAGLVFVPIGDAEAGSYVGSVNFSGGTIPQIFEIVDGDGIVLYTGPSPSSSTQISFLTSDDDDFSILVPATEDKQPRVDYQYKVTPVGAKKNAAATAGGGSGSSLLKSVVASVALVFVVGWLL